MGSSRTSRRKRASLAIRNAERAGGGGLRYLRDRERGASIVGALDTMQVALLEVRPAFWKTQQFADVTGLVRNATVRGRGKLLDAPVLTLDVTV